MPSAARSGRRAAASPRRARAAPRRAARDGGERERRVAPGAEHPSSSPRPPRHCVAPDDPSSARAQKRNGGVPTTSRREGGVAALKITPLRGRPRRAPRAQSGARACARRASRRPPRAPRRARRRNVGAGVPGRHRGGRRRRRPVVVGVVVRSSSAPSFSSSSTPSSGFVVGAVVQFVGPIGICTAEAP